MQNLNLKRSYQILKKENITFLIYYFKNIKYIIVFKKVIWKNVKHFKYRKKKYKILETFIRYSKQEKIFNKNYYIDFSKRLKKKYFRFIFI